MANENNNSNKDIANSLSKYSDYANKSTNLVLDSANAINKWYSEQLDKITESDIKSNRLETSIDNSTDEIENILEECKFLLTELLAITKENDITAEDFKTMKKS